MMKNKFLIITGVILIFLLFVALILAPVRKRAPVRKVPVVKGIIAIVIDDWGYHLDNLIIAKEIRLPLTCAILPNLKNSGVIAQQLNKLGFEVILHLPMQPKGKYRLEKNTITLNMDSGQVHNILNAGLASVIFAKGISNHMGSAITEDKRMSEIVMAETRKHNLYFLDSFVTPGSACRQIASKIKIRYARRDVFLDNQDDPVYIKGQLIKVMRLAKKQGSVIAIGHDRKNTLMVLNEMLPEMKEAGYKFVFVSEIAK